MKRDPEKFDDPAFSNFSIEDTFHDIENKFDINRIKKFQIVRKHYVAFGLITDLDDITEDDLTTLKNRNWWFYFNNTLPITFQRASIY